jgi:hypothetical protein
MIQFYAEGQLLQWSKGEKIGTVETIDSQESEWTLFKSGARIATDLINEFMIPIDSEPLDFAQVNPVLADVPVPNTILADTLLPTHDTIINKNPIRTLFNKQKKTDTIDLVLTFPISAPTSDIFDIINSTFDEAEVMDELTAFIMDQINVESIQTKLIDEIQDLITKKFKH